MQFIVGLACLFVMASCYHRQRPVTLLWQRDSVMVDDTLTHSTSFLYAENFNFLVKADSLVMLHQQPEEYLSGMPTDSFAVYADNRLVVADIRIIGQDVEDSVWVQLANEQQQFGWVREHVLLQSVVPDDPISEFISTFSDVHLISFLVFFCVIMVTYLLRKLLRREAPLVHFHDIYSFYPTLLTLIVAAAATFYASIQMFAPQVWRYFYFHPTLNPFDVPLILSVFLCSVWAILIVGLAAVEDVRRLLPIGEAITYLLGLGAVCAIDYIIFSITTLYYIGYVLLVAYGYYALRAYFRHSYARYICGYCGARLRHRGECPHCHHVNA